MRKEAQILEKSVTPTLKSRVARAREIMTFFNQPGKAGMTYENLKNLRVFDRLQISEKDLGGQSPK